MFVNNKSAIDNILKKDKEQKAKMASSFSFDDPRMLQMKEGNTYRMRLLFWIPEDKQDVRDQPFIEVFTHSGKGVNGYKEVNCPTSFDPTNNGFKACPICEKTSQLWNSQKNGNTADGELYKKLRRKFHGYALVLVQNDPENPENNGTVKMIHYGMTIKKFFDREIFGRVTTNKFNDEEEVSSDDLDPIGIDAFKLDSDGVDFIMTVEKKGEYREYTPKFARKSSAIDIDEAEIGKQLEAMNFDAKGIRHTKEDLDKFYREVVLHVTESDEPSGVDVPAETPAPSQQLKPSLGSAPKAKTEELDLTTDDTDVDDLINDIDIDDLLSDMD